MSKASDAAQLERLRRLAELPDDQIDTSDMPVVDDWSDGVRGGVPRDVRRKAAAKEAAKSRASARRSRRPCST
jgi:hypothetical protein